MSDPFAPDPLPTGSLAVSQLGIRHLLLWMTCSAMVMSGNFAANRATEASGWGSVPPEQRFFEGMLAVIEGVAVASLVLWINHLRCAQKFPSQPGHWLLVLQGITSLALLGGFLSWSFGVLQAEQGVSMFLLIATLSVALYIVMALCVRFPMRWRVLLFLVAVPWSCRAVVDLTAWSYFHDWHEFVPLVCFLPLVGIVVALQIDRRKGLQRDWLHGTGVAMCAAIMLLEIGQFGYYRWFLNAA